MGAPAALLDAARLITTSLRLDRPPVEFPPEVDWPQLVHHADGHSLTPLLYAVWRQAGLLGQLPLAIRRRMQRAYTDNAQRNKNIRAELLDIHQLLTEAGVPHLVLKGWPLVEQLYDEPAQRVLYDHDFLAPAERAESGHQALRAAGFRPLPARDAWIEKHLRPLWRNDGYRWDGYLFDPDYPRPVELHLRLWEDGWRGLRLRPLAGLWEDARTGLVAGQPMRLLSPENTLIHLAVHFAGHLVEREARLNQLLDLARFMQQESGRLRWPAVLARSEQANVARFVYASLWLAQRIYAAPLPPAAAWQQLAAATPPALRRWLAEQGVTDVLTGDFRQPDRGKDYQLTFLAAASIFEKLGIVRFALFPPWGQLAVKYGLQHRWQGPFYYPRYVLERLHAYSGAWRSKV